MSELHRVYLSIGSNIHPEIHLPKAIHLLGEIGIVRAISNAWESHAVGTSGVPNFLNACVLLETSLHPDDLKEKLVKPVETALGRQRSADKNAPRTIDIDLILVDNEPVNLEMWNHPFVILPLAELAPNTIHPHTGEKMIQAAERMRSETWIIERPETLKSVQQELTG